MSRTEQNLWLYLSVLSVFACANCMGAVDGALSKIADAMGVSHTTALYVGSIAALASMVSSLLLGRVLGRTLSYRQAAIGCTALIILGGTLPVVLKTFPLILAARLLFGVGVGGIMSLQNPLATRLVPPERLTTILGVGTATAFAVQCILQLVGGLLADIRWNFVFLTHLLLLLPFLVQLFHLPEVPLDRVQTRDGTREKLPASAVFLCVIMGLVGLNLAPLLFGSAFYVAAIHDSATVAAIIAMMFSIGSMAGGFLFPFLYGRLKGASLSAFLLISAGGLLMSAWAKSILVLGLGFFLGGVGNACVMACIMALLGRICHPTQVALASSLMMACMNLGAFLCSSWESFLGMLTGDALYTPLFVGAGIFLVIAGILLVRSPLSRSQ